MGLQRFFPFLSFIALVLVWFLGLDYRDLLHPSEGRYAELARSMLETGDWLTPRGNDLLSFEKPPLQTWGTAFFFSVFGLDNWVARLWSALAGFLGVFVVGFTALRMWSHQAAQFASMILAGSLWWLANSHFASLDMGMAFFMCLSLCAFLLGQHDDTHAMSARRAWMWVCWAAMALAVLSKGVIGVVFPAIVLLIYLAWTRDWMVLKRLFPISGLLIFLSLSLPWFVWMSLQHPDFLNYFFLERQVERYLNAQTQLAWWYLLPFFVIGALPWVSLLPRALKTGLEPHDRRFRPELLLFIWTMVIVLFFSFSATKNPSYILPIFPALALLMARYLTNAHYRGIHFLHPLIQAMFWSALCFVLWKHPEIVRPNDGLPWALHLEYRPWLLLGTLLLAASAFASTLAAWRKSSVAAVWLLAAGMLTGGQLMILGYQTYAHTQSAHILTQHVAPHLTADAPIFAYRTFDHSLPFYFKRPVILVEYSGEFALAQKLEAGKAPKTEREFLSAWQEANQAAVLVLNQDLPALQSKLARSKIAYEDSLRTVLIKR